MSRSRAGLLIAGLIWVCTTWLVIVPEVRLVTRLIQAGYFNEPRVDFLYFYTLGKMFNEYPAEKLYDYELQNRVLTNLQPHPVTIYSPNPYPPFVGLLFRPFAKMPYTRALLLWSFLSLSMYLGGVIVMTRRFFPGNWLRGSSILCFSLSLYPLVLTLNLGHISTIGFLAICLALCEQDRGHQFRAGMCLSACLYKPTLLLLFIPMLLITKRYRALAGFVAGGAAMAMLVTLAQGLSVWTGYAKLLFAFGSASFHAHPYINRLYYVDLSTFSALLPGGRRWFGLVPLFTAAACAFTFLARAWRNSSVYPGTRDTLIWATTLMWTMVLNVYVPIYDCVLLVPGMIATLATLDRVPSGKSGALLRLLWPAITFSTWATVPVAESTGLQLLTPLIALIGTLQLAALRIHSPDLHLKGDYVPALAAVST